MQKNPPLSKVYGDKEGISTSGIEFLTVHGQRAFIAFWISCSAAIPSEEDDAVTEIAGFFRWENVSKLLLYFFGLFSGRKT